MNNVLIKKRKEFLSELVAHKNSGVALGQLIKKYNIGQSLLTVIIELGYVRKLHGGVYEPLFLDKDIDTIVHHIATSESELNRSYLQKSGRNKKITPINLFSNEELINELKLRGFKGSIIPPPKTIDL